MKHENPDISVIIPVYNAQVYLRESLDSLITQTKQNIEVICIDDCSSDNSKHIISEYIASDSRISLICLPENHGQAYARNQGILKASGKYVYFMDADDMLSGVDSLSVMYNEIIKSELDGLLFDANIIFENEKLASDFDAYYLSMWREYPAIYKGAELFAQLIKNDDFHCTVWQQLWRTDFLRSNNLMFHPETSPHEDLLFSFQAMTLAKKISHLPKKLYTYRCRNNSSTTGGFTERRFRAYCVCYCEVKEFIKEHFTTTKMAEPTSFYLANIKSQLTEGYRLLLQSGIDPASFVFSDSKYAFFLQEWLREMTPHSGHVITLSEYEHIKSFANVIVYGAGNIGREVIQLLERCGITNYLIAVTSKGTDKRYVYGKEIYALSELKKLNQNAIVLLAAGSVYQQEMKANLKKLGFTEHLSMYR